MENIRRFSDPQPSGTSSSAPARRWSVALSEAPSVRWLRAFADQPPDGDRSPRLVAFSRDTLLFTATPDQLVDWVRVIDVWMARANATARSS